MRRRLFIKTLILSFTPSICRSNILSAEFQQHLNNAWSVPHNASIELWPVRIGLDINETLSAISEWSISLNSRVILRFDDGVYKHTQPIIFQHPNGKQIAIIGNTTNPEKCRFQWSNSNDAIYVNAANVLGLIDGITMEHTSKETRGLGSAFLADNGGVIFCGRNIKVYNFYYGFQARFAGVIQCNETVSYGAGDANYFAFNGGFISAEKAKAFNARDDDQKLGSGFVAEYGGAINAAGALASKNAFSGFTALSNGVIRANESHATLNGRAGYYTSTGGVIVAHDGIAELNCGKGLLQRGNKNSFEGNHFFNKNNSKNSKLCMGETSHD